MYTLIQIDIDRWHVPHTLKTGIRDNILKISLDMTNEIVEFGYKKKHQPTTMVACSFKDKRRNYSMSYRNWNNRHNYQ